MKKKKKKKKKEKKYISVIDCNLELNIKTTAWKATKLVDETKYSRFYSGPNRRSTTWIVAWKLTSIFIRIGGLIVLSRSGSFPVRPGYVYVKEIGKQLPSATQF